MRFHAKRQCELGFQGRKTLYTDVKNAPFVPKCRQDVYVELLAEAGVQEDECG